MSFEKAFQDTLTKWREIAAGKPRRPGGDCGLCEWADRAITRPGPGRCKRCPAWHHYGEMACGDAVLAIGEAVYCHDEMLGGDKELGAHLQKCAERVVTELLAIKESLFEWANKLEKGK